MSCESIRLKEIDKTRVTTAYDMFKSFPLRLIEWSLTNYTKEISTFCKSEYISRHINVYNSYKSNLKHWGRDMFDMFGRQTSKQITIDNITMTFAQANFYEWAIWSGFANFFIDNVNKIRDHMTGTHKKHKLKKIIFLISFNLFITIFNHLYKTDIQWCQSTKRHLHSIKKDKPAIFLCGKSIVF